MRLIFTKTLIASLLLLESLAYGSGTDHVGIVKSISGDVAIIRNTSTIKAVTNLKLLKGDVIQTGADGKAGLILEDDTVISMGPDSRIAIIDFMFQPHEKKLSLITRVFQGTISFLSGQIARLAPQQVRIETPNATVGTRGTHVLIQVDQE